MADRRSPTTTATKGCFLPCLRAAAVQQGAWDWTRCCWAAPGVLQPGPHNHDGVCLTRMEGPAAPP